MNYLQDKVRTAVEQFVCNDLKLLELKVYEAAVSHRIAVYLEYLFLQDKRYAGPRFHFDCEYDKNLDLRKRDVYGNGIRPDILVHRRCERTYNIIAIEIKRRNKSRKDFRKLAFLTDHQRDFGYALGAFVHFPNHRPRYVWFERGVELRA